MVFGTVGFGTPSFVTSGNLLFTASASFSALAATPSIYLQSVVQPLTLSPRSYLLYVSSTQRTRERTSSSPASSVKILTSNFALSRGTSLIANQPATAIAISLRLPACDGHT